jgi:hypothetical protein
MHSKSSKKERQSNVKRSEDGSTPFGLERLSKLLEKYGVASQQGSVEKLSQLAEEIVSLIAQKRRHTTSGAYYRRRIE